MTRHVHNPTPVASMPKVRSLARACSSAGLSYVCAATAHSVCIQGNPDMAQGFISRNNTHLENFRFPQLVALQQKVGNPKDDRPKSQPLFYPLALTRAQTSTPASAAPAQARLYA